MRIESFEHLVDVSQHEPVEGIEGAADAVIGDAILRKVLGSYSITAIARTDE